MKIIVISLSLLFCLCSQAQDFISLVKNTESVYSQVMDVDALNNGRLNFETLLSNQKTYLTLSTSKLNSAFISIINSDSSAKKISTANVTIRNLNVIIDDEVTPSVTCNGDEVSGTSCTGQSCTINQRIISKCNEDSCWETSPGTPRNLTSPISENFSLKSKVDISDCVPNNISGQKHVLKVSVENTSASVLNGGTINMNLFLRNDTSVSSKRTVTR